MLRSIDLFMNYIVPLKFKHLESQSSHTTIMKNEKKKNTSLDIYIYIYLATYRSRDVEFLFYFLGYKNHETYITAHFGHHMK